ncbi:MAG TPA: alpha/beta hydrolase [Alphaproteobacteria bacterium]|nr:alpha/beta hydrolase [Alphaproteobacteria bacterium]
MPNSIALVRQDAALLDPAEAQFRIPSPIAGLRLFLRHLPPRAHRPGASPVLYVHGGTFPSALSIAHRFDGLSWREDLAAAGVDVWGLDFLGFGESDRYPEMAAAANAHPALGGAETASRQIEAAARFITGRHATTRLSIIAHSWGSIAAGRFAARCPELVDRLVFFGPIPRRAGKTPPESFDAWRLVSLEDQWRRFTAEVPAGEAPVLARRHFAEWGPLYLDSDPESRTRTPPSVKVPSGPWQDIANAFAGDLAYDPAAIRAPVAIIRGEWDSLITDEDARWLFDAFVQAPIKRDVKIGRATHLMHLEAGRHELYRAARSFLEEGPRPS